MTFRFTDEQLAAYNTALTRKRSSVGNVEIVRGLPDPLERDIQAAILDFLKIHPRVAFAYRMNTGGMQDAYGNHVRFGFRGSPDIHGVLKGGRALFIEVKRKAGKMRPGQQEFIDAARQAGALAFVARSVSDVMRALVAKEAA